MQRKQEVQQVQQEAEAEESETRELSQAEIEGNNYTRAPVVLLIIYTDPTGHYIAYPEECILGDIGGRVVGLESHTPHYCDYCSHSVRNYRFFHES